MTATRKADPSSKVPTLEKSASKPQLNNTTLPGKHQEQGDIQKALQYLYNPGDVFELCLIAPENRKSSLWGGEYVGGKKPIVAGWFDNPEKALEAIIAAEKEKPAAIYVTLNPTLPALLGRSNNRLKAHVARTKDSETAEVRHLLIDADPVRPTDTSSSDEEKNAALELIRAIYKDLKTAGWPEPLAADSGNGGHLIYKLMADCQDLVPDLLKAFNRQYSTPVVSVDTTVGNPSRLVKVYGTTTRKGDSTENRPHRMAKILSYPEEDCQ